MTLEEMIHLYFIMQDSACFLTVFAQWISVNLSPYPEGDEEREHFKHISQSSAGEGSGIPGSLLPPFARDQEVLHPFLLIGPEAA